MPVQPTYPGIYIEELPPSERTITAAPTSIAVFIGYAHPFWKPERFNEAVRVQSFGEYERALGGHFVHTGIPNALPVAVQQFFLNGGADAYVVGLKPAVNDPTAEALGSTGLTVVPRAPVSALMPMKVSVSMPRGTGTDVVVDVTVSYGTRTETLRGIRQTAPAGATVAETINNLSSLITVAETGGVSFGHTAPFALDVADTTLSGAAFDATAFTQVFADEGSLDKVDIFNLMAIPGVSDPTVLAVALAFCERKRAFFIMDPPANATADEPSTAISDPAMRDSLPNSTNGALYFPYLDGVHPLTQERTLIPPSGVVAGVFARTDNDRGVWKAPAGLETILKNVRGVVPTGRMTDKRAGILNERAVNAIRTFPGVGTVVFGARTLVGDVLNTAFQHWRYVPVRRTALFLEKTFERNLGWVVFEPNDEPLWVTIRTSIDAFMMSLFRQGAFQGSKPSEAFLVQCDRTTTTQQDINNGIVNIVVGFRPLKPAEFVIVKIAQLAGQAQA